MSRKRNLLPTNFTHIPITAETFLDKLACGFGRVVLFLHENDAVPFREAILDSCLHHRTFDQQTESYRTDYLFDIMRATGEPEFYAAPYSSGTQHGRCRVQLRPALRASRVGSHGMATMRRDA